MWKSALALYFAVALATPVSAQAPEWEGRLGRQLAEQEKCTLSYLTNVRETKKDGGVNVVGRAHCEDGRAFDISGTKEKGAFDLQSCKVNAC